LQKSEFVVASVHSSTWRCPPQAQDAHSHTYQPRQPTTHHTTPHHTTNLQLVDMRATSTVLIFTLVEAPVPEDL
jgi:hypothetical protein